ncbi:aminotransferase class V-fold PLP-dependent enzyme [Fulvivirga sp.]|uniref:aminotransferase class V-fold PLP-dependent enzyme n=1 Tax=Fulvivirga sp. TaxID=1931237 RepID=UPI0032EB918B
MEEYFAKFRKNIIGINHKISTPYHEAIKIVYADWTASGRLYQPIEDTLQSEIYPLIGNTHTETTSTGQAMTYAYNEARNIIKAHVGASGNDVLISAGSGMTGAVNKLQRILGLRVHESFLNTLTENERPIIFISHMEHHSNHTSWLETIADVEIVAPDANGLVSVDNFEKALDKHQDRKRKIVAITACSNVTGIITPYMDIAAIAHRMGALCFVDFACSGPYVDINMHDDDKTGRYLDAIYFSPHKFLGGPGSSGILVFNKCLYQNNVPDNPGGGTVDWTNPWGEHKYSDNIEIREDGGTPPFLQTIRAAMSIQLKETMGVENISTREAEIVEMVWSHLDDIPNLHVLAGSIKKRLPVISFYIDGLHHNLGVKMLNDRFGIQTRGGCSCAGTYGHYLLHIDKEHSHSITDQISHGDNTNKPGWIRMSFHPTQSNEEIVFILKAIQQLTSHYEEWSKDYSCNLAAGIIKCMKDDGAQRMELEIKEILHQNFAD